MISQAGQQVSDLSVSGSDKSGNIVLVGFMGSGKSAVGRELQRLTGFRLVDVDTEVERAEGMSINDIFSSRGEAAFRDAEAREISRISESRGQIISTGGGAVLRQDNIETLSGSGAVVCLSASPETIYKRTKRNRDRPLLQVDDPLKKIREMLAQRQPYYDKADATIDTEGKNPFEIATEVLEAVGWKR
jgi:shikimate kinase